jgi:hypothetical protein
MREVQTHVFAEQLILFLSSEVLLSSEVQTHVFAEELILLFTMTMGKEEEKQQQQQQQHIPWRPRDFSSVKNHPLSGITFAQWYRLVRKYRGDIEYFRYFPRLVFLTVMSMFNALFACVEMVCYGSAISKTIVDDDPVIIVGHPRTGTTHLHNLLTLDEDSFYTCTTFDVGFPSSFLLFPKRVREMLKTIMDDTRPMDNMRLAHDSPQEDEVATNQLSSCLASPYAPLMFPKLEEKFRPFYRLDGEDEEYPCKLEDARIWRDNFWYFVQKVTYAAENSRKKDDALKKKRRRLVLKSPVHMARIKLLARMFPKAQFLVCHRHPYETFQSAANMADKYYWSCFLQAPRNREEIEEFIFRQGEILHDAYEKDLKDIDDLTPRVMEIPFKELDEKPLQTLEKIYNKFEFKPRKEKYKGSDAETKAKAYIESAALKNFKKNAFSADLSRATKREINRRWRTWFRLFDYTKF